MLPSNEQVKMALLVNDTKYCSECFRSLTRNLYWTFTKDNKKICVDCHERLELEESEVVGRFVGMRMRKGVQEPYSFSRIIKEAKQNCLDMGRVLREIDRRAVI